MPANIWPRERIDYLAEIWREGFSFSELADCIASRFGVAVTRSAVAGKVNRMKLSTIKRIRRLPKARTPQTLAAATTLKPARQAPPPRPALKPLMIDILELTRHTCRFPYGDVPPYLYCGCPPLKGSPYCVHHTKLCWNHSPLNLGD
jgi:GcrA cell cycle regulator